ncbi:hypothetical protein C0Q70_15582 [Pomacea canaliculata]|uniref:FAS1 domain-containing protein n=1 Tax=Pomacea canaliculata TaxID=400727 RepID=A0A2T7NVA4_POMCA|nr:hypothetical protein C0Q70_15582 [Pomacea canaliculata]
MTEADKTYNAPTLPELVKSLGLNALYDSVVKAKLADALSSKGPFTLFAPTDAAFAAMPDWEKEATSNITILTKILKYHVLNGKVLSSDLKNELLVPTLEGQEVRLNIYPNSVVTVQCSPIDLNNVDKLASNGVLHEISRVMLPPAGTVVDAIAACPVFQDLKLAVGVAGLDAALRVKGPYTVFAPTDKAFEQLPPGALDNLLKNKTALTEVLLYHVVKNTYCSAGLSSVSTLTTLGGKDLSIAVTEDAIKVNNAKVLPGAADGSVSNGVVHAIDAVLLPPEIRSRPVSQLNQL